MRLLFVLSGLGIACATTACGEEELAGIESMSLREMMGLDPERVDELTDTDRAAITEALVDRWDAALAAPDDPQVHALSADASPLEIVGAHDGHRLERGLDIAVSARIDALDGDRLEVRVTPLPRELIGLETVADGARLRVLPLDTRQPHHRGELVADTRWGRVELEALEGRSELETLDVLAPALRRYLYQVGLTDEPARLVRAPRAPLALWYDAEQRALLINPVLLRLLGDDDPDGDEGRLAPAVGGQFVTGTWALTPDFVARCIGEQRDRCDLCFGERGDPTRSVCGPIFEPPDDTAPLDHAGAECAELEARPGDDGFALLCYHISLQANLGCFLTADPDDRCGAAAVPVSSVAGLESVRPMLTDAVCQDQLQQCHDDRIVDPPPDVVVEDDDDSDDDGESSALDDAGDCAECGASICDVFSGASVCAETDTGGGGGGGGLCEGDGLDGADACCEGDGDDGGGDPTSATASIANVRRTTPGAMLFVVPFLFLLGVYWRARGDLTR